MASILIVETDPTFLAAGTSVLSRGGYEVLSAANADEACAVVATREPFLVLLDGNLGDRGVLLKLSIASVRPLTVIFTFRAGHGRTMTEMLDQSSDLEAIQVIGFVEKPFAADVLLTTVDEGVRASAESRDNVAAIDVTQRLALELRAREEEDTQVGEQPGLLYRALGLDVDLSNIRARRDLDKVESPRSTKRGERIADRVARRLAEHRPLHPDDIDVITRACEEALAEEHGDEDDSSVAASGSLVGIQVFQLLQLVEGLSTTSEISLTQGSVAIDIFVDNRNVVFARQRNLPETYRLGHFLIDLGRIEEKDVDSAIVGGPNDLRLFGEKLLAAGRVSPDDLTVALKKQTEELVYEALCWSEGRFVVRTNVELAEVARSAGVSVSVQGILLEGMHRMDEWQRITGDLGGLSAIVKIAGDIAEKADLSRTHRIVLDEIDGERSVRDLARSLKRRPYDIVRALHQLHEQSLVSSS